MPSPDRLARLRGKVSPRLARSEPADDIRFSPASSPFAWPILIGLLASVWVRAAAIPPPSLSCGLPQDAKTGIHQCSDGTVDLAWAAADAVRFELQHSAPEDGEFRSRYTGPDRSTVCTGLAAGLHRFRVRAIGHGGSPSSWSDPLQVEVRYMAWGKVRLLLVLGAVVVGSTIATILYGHSRRKPTAAS